MNNIFNINEFLIISETLFQENDYYPICLEDVADKMKLSVNTLRKYLKQEIKIHPNFIMPDYFYVLRRKLHNFDTLTEESSYWLGYLFADGCYTKSRGLGKRLMLECKRDDKEILEKFCDFLNIRRSRITIAHKGQSVALSLTDNHFSTSVSEWGIQMNKSHVENHVPLAILENDKMFFQFLRGIIDGDGTVHTYRRSPGISFITNSKIFCQEIKKKLQDKLPTPSSVWLTEIDKDKVKKATQSLYSLKIGVGRERNNIDFLFSNMYEGQKIILTRKYEAFQKLLVR